MLCPDASQPHRYKRDPEYEEHMQSSRVRTDL